MEDQSSRVSRFARDSRIKSIKGLLGIVPDRVLEPEPGRGRLLRDLLGIADSPFSLCMNDSTHGKNDKMIRVVWLCGVVPCTNVQRPGTHSEHADAAACREHAKSRRYRTPGNAMETAPSKVARTRAG
jgi:hypothetical protein